MNGLVDPLRGIKEIISVTPWKDLLSTNLHRDVQRSVDSVFTQPVTVWHLVRQSVLRGHNLKFLLRRYAVLLSVYF
jgi:hypothetical protein